MCVCIAGFPMVLTANINHPDLWTNISLLMESLNMAISFFMVTGGRIGRISR